MMNSRADLISSIKLVFFFCTHNLIKAITNKKRSLQHWVPQNSMQNFFIIEMSLLYSTIKVSFSWKCE